MHVAAGILGLVSAAYALFAALLASFAVEAGRASASLSDALLGEAFTAQLDALSRAAGVGDDAVRRSLDLHPFDDCTDDACDLVLFPQDE